MWIAAQKNIPGFPDYPRDLSEPQYARLVFDQSCVVSLPPDTTCNAMLTPCFQALWKYTLLKIKHARKSTLL
jgi:hypothetical protein